MPMSRPGIFRRARSCRTSSDDRTRLTGHRNFRRCQAASAAGVRLTHNEAQGGWVLLAPERIFKADAIAVEILKRCTGEATFGAIVDDLAATFKAPRERIETDVANAAALARRQASAGLVVTDLRPQAPVAAASGERDLPAPLGLLAELTHRCPLGCPYCSNPLALDAPKDELDTETWARVFREAAALGILQVHLSGGEPASRRDLADIVKSAHTAGLYSNLITSGVGLTDARLRALADNGLDHVQVSIQDAELQSADRIAATTAHLRASRRWRRRPRGLVCR